MTPEATNLLKARARELARPRAIPTAESMYELLEFNVAGERYAVDIQHVREAHPLRDLTPLPSTPPFVLGIVSVRGRLIPVYDLRKFFGLAEQGITDLHRVIIVRGNDLELGLLADAVIGLRSIPVASVQPALPTLSGVRAEYLKGVTAERLVVLDIARILEDPRIIVHDETEN